MRLEATMKKRIKSIGHSMAEQATEWLHCTVTILLILRSDQTSTHYIFDLPWYNKQKDF